MRYAVGGSRERLCRVHCRVHLDLCRVPKELGKQREFGSASLVALGKGFDACLAVFGGLFSRL